VRPIRRPQLVGPLRDMTLVGAGLVSVGAGSAGALALSSRTLSPREFAAFATWLMVGNLTGLAFVSVEMYLPRPLLALRAAGADTAPTIKSVTVGTVACFAAAAAGLAIASPWLVRSLFGGRPGLFGLLLLYAAGLSLQTVQRGVAVGRERFEVVGLQLGADGLIRLGGAVALFLVGTSSPTTFAAVLCAGALGGALVGGVAGPQWSRWRGPRGAIDAGALGLLALASIGPLIVNNGAVPWLTGTGGVRPEVVGAVAGALTLTRIPTLLVGAAYGPVLAPLAAFVDSASRGRFRLLHHRSLAAAAVVALLFAATFGLVGPSLLTVYLGPSFRLSHLELASMAAGSGLMFVCVVEQAALVALSAWSHSGLAWAAGVLCFGATLAAPGDPVFRASLAVLLGPLVAAAVMAVACRRAEERVFASPETSGGAAA
jgi:O-antigen/teichoic acid export membrane protein